MLSIALSAIDADYLLALPKAGGPAESRTLDYKRDFTLKPGEIDGSELRADVSAFANSEGGDLVVGVDESHGLPAKVDGIPCDDADKLKLRLDGMLATIEPRIAYGLRVFALPSGRAVVIIRTRPSFAAPHRTSATGGFYVRSDSGKYPMSIDQVREAFVASAGLEGRLKEFRRDRLPFVGALEPYKLADGARVVVHFMPLLGATRPGLLDIVEHRLVLAEAGVTRFAGDTGEMRLNFDGLQIAITDQTGAMYGYSQWYRTGFREVAWVEGEDVPPLLASSAFPEVSEPGYWAFDELEVEIAVAATVRQSLRVCADINIPPPFLIGLSVMGCRGYRLGKFNARRRRIMANPGSRAVEVDRLVIPEVIADDTSVDVKTLLQPAFNQIANAFGCLRASDYE